MNELYLTINIVFCSKKKHFMLYLSEGPWTSGSWKLVAYNIKFISLNFYTLTYLQTKSPQLLQRELSFQIQLSKYISLLPLNFDRGRFQILGAK